MNWRSKVIPVALALSLLASTSVFADNTVTGEEAKTTDGLRPFFAAKLNKDDSQKQWRKGPRMMNTENCTVLTDEQKAALNELKEELRAGNLTPDQAKEKMSELFPEGMPQRLNQDQRGLNCQLNPELANQVSELKEKLLNEEITREQFQESMQEIMPEDCNFMGRKGGFNKGKGFGARLNM